MINHEAFVSELRRDRTCEGSDLVSNLLTLMHRSL